MGNLISKNGSKLHRATFWFALFILVLSAFLNVQKLIWPFTLPDKKSCLNIQTDEICDDLAQTSAGNVYRLLWPVSSFQSPK